MYYEVLCVIHIDTEVLQIVAVVQQDSPNNHIAQ